MPSCYFIITGFGPFAGVSNNPTSILIKRLQEQLDNNQNKHKYETHLLETSAEYVREKLSDIYKGLKQSSSEKSSKDIIIILHLGVMNYSVKVFHLEQCAYNDATFRVADERGYRPNKELVLQKDNETSSESTHEWGKCLKTTLDVHSLCNDLQKECKAEKVVVSTDPGRFVCNYTYCFSLNQCNSANKCSEEGKKQHNALFIHVPPFRVISEIRQLDFIHKVMDTIEKQVLSSTD